MTVRTFGLASVYNTTCIPFNFDGFYFMTTYNPSAPNTLILGLANDRSIAWGIAKACADAGHNLAFTYQGDALRKRVEPLAASLGSNIILPCDVATDAGIDECFSQLKQHWDRVDNVVHAVAFSDKAELEGLYVDTTKANFQNTMDISVYSLTAVTQRAIKLMPEAGGSIITLTYYGAEQVMPHYNVMGVAKAALEASVRYLAADLGSRNIRVNAISAGPIKTLAASGIGDFRTILRWNELNAPLKRNVTIEEVGLTAEFLLSNRSSGITGEVMHVDCGYHTVGMLSLESVTETAELLTSIAPRYEAKKTA